MPQPQLFHMYYHSSMAVRVDGSLGLYVYDYIYEVNLSHNWPELSCHCRHWH